MVHKKSMVHVWLVCECKEYTYYFWHLTLLCVTHIQFTFDWCVLESTKRWWFTWLWVMAILCWFSVWLRFQCTRPCFLFYFTRTCLCVVDRRKAERKFCHNCAEIDSGFSSIRWEKKSLVFSLLVLLYSCFSPITPTAAALSGFAVYLHVFFFHFSLIRLIRYCGDYFFDRYNKSWRVFSSFLFSICELKTEKVKIKPKTNLLICSID